MIDIPECAAGCRRLSGRRTAGVCRRWYVDRSQSASNQLLHALLSGTIRLRRPMVFQVAIACWREAFSQI